MKDEILLVRCEWVVQNRWRGGFGLVGDLLSFQLNSGAGDSLNLYNSLLILGELCKEL